MREQLRGRSGIAPYQWDRTQKFASLVASDAELVIEIDPGVEFRETIHQPDCFWKNLHREFRVANRYSMLGADLEF